MPRPFTSSEQGSIRHSLRSAASALFAAQGVSRTSIEQITKAAGIAKGSFYRFHPSKEALFFDLLEDTQNQLRAPLLAEPMDASTAPERGQFEHLVQTMFTGLHSNPLIALMGQQQELMAIRRRVPDQTLLAHQAKDQRFLEQLIRRWNQHPTPPARDQVAARVTLLVLVGLQQEFFGERLFPLAATAAITSLVDCFFPPAPATTKATGEP